MAARFVLLSVLVCDRIKPHPVIDYYVQMYTAAVFSGGLIQQNLI